MYKNFFICLLFCTLFQPFCRAENKEKATTSTSTETKAPLPVGSDSAIVIYPSIPSWEYFNYSPWHEGFNASLSMFASIGIGKHSPKGAGFGKDISLAYVKPLGNRWAYALATNINTMKWGSRQWNQASIGGELSYALSDRVSFSLTGYKELVRPNTFPPFYRSLNAFRDNYDSYFGGAVNLKFNENFFMQVSFGTGTEK